MTLKWMEVEETIANKGNGYLGLLKPSIRFGNSN